MSLPATLTGVVVATLPLSIAKAMKPLIHKDKPDIAQVLCEAGPDLGRDRTARYVGTNGNVMLIVDTDLPAPTESQVFSGMKYRNADTGKWNPTDVDLVVSSKGHYRPEYTRAQDAPEFPDYKPCIPTGEGEAVERIGLDVAYVDLALKIHKALGLGKPTTWSVTFHGLTAPIVWEPTQCDGGVLNQAGVTRVIFIVMPVRLD
jgi:hypothetical protein